MNIIFATKNKSKLKEINEILKDTTINVTSLEQIGLNIDVIEDQDTFLGNAIKKAVEIMKVTNEIVLSDDSGIEIDYLDKKPGVLSARFLGQNTPYIDKNNKILEMLQGVEKEKRTARFVCVIAAAFPDGNIITTTGVMEGYIHTEISGDNGFGYDPIFYVEEYNMTTANMTSDIKNKISHRGKALTSMKVKLCKLTN